MLRLSEGRCFVVTCQLTIVAADGRGQVVGLCMLKGESPAAELGR
jgi:hypothetical protein